MTVQLDDVERARERIGATIAPTPLLRSETLSQLTGAEIFLKFENLQFTASFKERGALNRLLQLSDDERRGGVIAMSAGNHAQAVAYHGRRLGVPTCIVMPRSTPNSKVEQTRVFGAEVILRGSQFDETRAFTLEEAQRRNAVLVHPFDDDAVIAGQGTLGLEVLEQAPEIEVLVVPVGGGGLIGGTSLAVKSKRPQIEIVGVQAERFPAAYHMFHGTDEPAGVGKSTVAEGIAVKSPGTRTITLIRKHVDDIVLVTEELIERAIFNLLEIEKTLTEGAGAAGLAAVLRYPQRFAGRKTCLVLTGGNIDMMILSSILQRGLVRSRRLVRLRVELADVPGALGQVTQLLGELDSNIIDIVHQRAFAGSSARAAVVDFTLQMRGEEQADQVVEALAAHGLEVKMVDL